MDILEILKTAGIEIPEDKKTEINKSLRESYKHITEVDGIKQQLTTVQSELEAAKTQIQTANDTIASFGDVEAIKSQVSEYKTKYEQSESEYQTKFETAKTEYETKLADLALDSALKDKLAGFKFSSEYAKQGVFNEIKSKGLKLEGDKIIGFDDVFNPIKEAQPTAFAEDNTDPVARVDFSKQSGGGAAKSTDPSAAMNNLIRSKGETI